MATNLGKPVRLRNDGGSPLELQTGANVASVGVAAANTIEVPGNVHVSGGDRTIFNRSNNSLAFGTNNTERVRIDSAGRVGIGPSVAPTDLLDVRGSARFGTTRVYTNNATQSQTSTQTLTFTFDGIAGSSAALIKITVMGRRASGSASLNANPAVSFMFVSASDGSAVVFTPITNVFQHRYDTGVDVSLAGVSASSFTVAIGNPGANTISVAYMVEVTGSPDVVLSSALIA